MDRTRKRLERGKRTHPTNPQPQRRDEVSTNSADSVKEHNWSERIELLQGARKFSPSISGPFLVGRPHAGKEKWRYLVYFSLLRRASGSSKKP
jgi:hypothetical protein